jgi:hypothetical protein
MPSFAQLFCCLNPDERGALRGSAAAFIASLGIGVPFILWDALWLPGIPSRDARQESFIGNYGLARVTEDFGEPPVMTDLIIFTDTAYWAEKAVFILTPAAACLDGCSLCVPYPCPP